MKIRKLLNKYKSIILSTTFAAILVVASYIINNFPLIFGESTDQYFFIQHVAELFHCDSPQDYDDAFFVNVSYDKALVDTYQDGSETPCGNAAITDRSKLYKFLKILHDSDSYKYIIVDLNFDKNEVSAADSMLYDLIAKMERIVIVRDGVNTFPREELLDKSALAHYYSTAISSNFARFEYVNGDDERYIPLKAFEDLNPDIHFKRHGAGRLAIFSDGKGLCNSCSALTFDSKDFSTYDKGESSDFGFEAAQSFFNLSSDLLENQALDTDEERAADIAAKADDSYVVIGNFIEDLHDTYIGTRPGPVILYRALKALEEGRHRISFWHELFWFAVYALIFWFIITGRSLSNYIIRALRCPGKFICFILNMIEITAVLIICSVGEFILTDNIHAVMLPLLAFSIVKLFYNYKSYEAKQ